ncbi:MULTISPECIES: MFS transporter [unclassified Acinetobacter]|uniref:MFS transporter n=1 Tax=unclassified Acinetobacter TaxID=196816 RepID=UPI002934D868|nr:MULTISPECIES: MFS transporter [unclassified Acinetobacter]WOE30838.1 MFS transporter [Acinetobacter sp. SAAs470]WOE39033.1 MFS transporter [Acinetobacter sp. SAAs474]
MSVSTQSRLPLSSLLALATAVFITILTEALPAGVMPRMALSLHVSEALVGQTITIYAIGSLVAAIPLTIATQGMRRRPLLMLAIAGFLVANTVTVFSLNYMLTMIARFLAGVSAGVLWALLAGYASRMVPNEQKGKAIAIAMVGTPLAFSLGVPAGTFLGNLMGWQVSFGLMSLMAFVLLFWIYFAVPDFEGQPITARLPIKSVLMIAGIRPVLWVVLCFVLAHNILYTYITPFLGAVGMLAQTDTVLLIFGILSLLGIWGVGIWVDRHLRMLIISSAVLFILAISLIHFASSIPLLIFFAAAMWGVAFGGLATLLQTAIAKAAGDAGDIAQSMLVTSWNTAIAGGGLIGGILLESFGIGSFTMILFMLMIATLVIIVLAKHHGFPSR